MPKLYEYLGIMIFFWSNEHSPIHVHGRKGGKENKAIIHTQDGKIVKIEIVKTPGTPELSRGDKSLSINFYTFSPHLASP